MPLLKFLVLIFVVIGIGGCHRSEPVYTVTDEKIPAVAQQGSVETVKATIIQAAIDKGWRIQEIGPGELQATVAWKDHSATSNIFYSLKNYSITLDSSKNLKEQNGTIHRKYNQAVQALENEIDKRLYQIAR